LDATVGGVGDEDAVLGTDKAAVGIVELTVADAVLAEAHNLVALGRPEGAEVRQRVDDSHAVQRVRLVAREPVKEVDASRQTLRDNDLFEVAILVEDLDAPIVRIGDIYQRHFVRSDVVHDPVRELELVRRRLGVYHHARAADRPLELPVRTKDQKPV
jgi:hypothetical protein